MVDSHLREKVLKIEIDTVVVASKPQTKGKKRGIHALGTEVERDVGRTSIECLYDDMSATQVPSVHCLFYNRNESNFALLNCRGRISDDLSFVR